MWFLDVPVPVSRREVESVSSEKWQLFNNSLLQTTAKDILAKKRNQRNLAYRSVVRKQEIVRRHENNKLLLSTGSLQDEQSYREQYRKQKGYIEQLEKGIGIPSSQQTENWSKINQKRLKIITKRSNQETQDESSDCYM